MRKDGDQEVYFCCGKQVTAVDCNIPGMGHITFNALFYIIVMTCYNTVVPCHTVA